MSGNGLKVQLMIDLKFRQADRMTLSYWDDPNAKGGTVWFQTPNGWANEVVENRGEFLNLREEVGESLFLETY